MARDSISFAYPARKHPDFEIAPPRFSGGGVFITSIQVLIRNGVPFGIITALIGIPYIAMILSGLAPSPLVYHMSAARFDASVSEFAFDSTPIGIVLALTYIVTQCAINYGTFQDLCGKKVVVGECLTRGLGAMVKVVLASIYMSMVVGVVAAVPVLISISFPLAGFLLIPATVAGFVMLYVMWWVFVPVIVVEGGFIECFRRSRKLTKGNRWGIFGLLLIVAAVASVSFLAIAGVAVALGPMAGKILAIVAILISFAFTGVLNAVGYYKLRADREGINTDDLARIFD